MTTTDLFCDDPEREPLLRASDLDGIDAVEVPFDDQTHLRVYFVKGPPPAGITVDQVRVEGGVRITGIEVVAVQELVDADGEDYLEVTVDQPGDFSPYALHVDDPRLDARFDHRRFGFKVGCPDPFDCAPTIECPPDAVETPVIDYMAKDYASFRQLLIDRIPAHVPEWTDRHAADLGMTLIELLAYEGDLLSYRQDAVAQEMHLATARQRESVARHVRLIDYPMHHGINAKTFVHLTVELAGTIPARSLRCPDRTVRFLSRVGEPVDPHSTMPPGPVIDSIHTERALAVADAVFEPVETVHVTPELNDVFIHTWGDAACCLPAGTTAVDLVGEVPIGPGDLLLLEETVGVATGLAQDADPTHRQVVRLVELPTGVDVDGEDPLFTAGPPETGGVRPREAGDPPLAVTRVAWDPEDALRFPLCVSTRDADGDPIVVAAVARGNIVLADHGRTTTETHVPDETTVRYSRIGYRFRLRQAPLTFGFGRDAAFGGPVARLFALSPRHAEPHVVLIDGDGSGLTWVAEPDLLGSDPFSTAFVAEPDHDGRALLRFGDGEFGRRPAFPSSPDEAEQHRLHAIFRIGVGRSGNIGRDSLVHLLAAGQPVPDAPVISAVRNPLAAWGGVDPEPVARVKAIAPAAFRAETYRAVTEDDYTAAAELLPGVARARAEFRWTGSWYTVFVTIDPRGTDELTPRLRAEVRTHLDRYRLAGYDLEIRPPIHVALEIAIEVCVEPGHFRAQVHAAVADALSARTLPDGTPGFFHPDRFTFAQPLHLSALYAAVEAVEGVDSAEVTVFQRYGDDTDAHLTAGRIDVGRFEILRLSNDRNFPEHGVLTLEMRGGK